MESGSVTRMSEVAIEQYDWGAIKWLMSQQLNVDAQQTFGIVFIQPGSQNPPPLPSQLRGASSRNIRAVRTRSGGGSLPLGGRGHDLRPQGGRSQCGEYGMGTASRDHFVF